MKNKMLSKSFYLFTVAIFLYAATYSASNYADNYNENLPKAFSEKKFTLNFKNTNLAEAIRMIARHAGLEADVPSSLNGNISYSFNDITLENALGTMAKGEKFTYHVKDNMLYISSDKTGVSSSGGGRSHQIELRYVIASEIYSKVVTLLEPGEKLIVDDPSNSLILYSSLSTANKVASYIEAIDKMPIQILIEAQIIEINKNKANELGISYGNLTQTPDTLTNTRSPNWSISNPPPKSPNAAISVGIGSIQGSLLSAKILAAESSGDAKVVSRPKIVTLNNIPATINSGVTFNVKTLSSTATDSSSSSGGLTTATGGVKQISAGLNLNVTPTVLDKNKIKLLISVTNSAPDLSTVVDGIPGIADNSAHSTIIVGDGITATLAGLIKNMGNQSRSGVPFLSRIPVLGWFFRSTIESDQDSEIMIFITPHIVE